MVLVPGLFFGLALCVIRIIGILKTASPRAPCGGKSEGLHKLFSSWLEPASAPRYMLLWLFFLVMMEAMHCQQHTLQHPAAPSSTAPSSTLQQPAALPLIGGGLGALRDAANGVLQTFRQDECCVPSDDSSLQLTGSYSGPLMAQCARADVTMCLVQADYWIEGGAVLGLLREGKIHRQA